MTDLWLQYIDILIAFVQQIANQNLTFCTLGRAVYFFYLYSILYPLRPFLKHWFEFGINFTHSYLVRGCSQMTLSAYVSLSSAFGMPLGASN